MERSFKVMIVGMFIGTFSILGYLVFSDRDELEEYVFIPNKTILKKPSYLMKIESEELLEKLKDHPSITKRERLGLGKYLENVNGNLIANSDETIKAKFERLEDYKGTNETILGIDFKASKMTVSKPVLCELISSEIVLKKAGLSKNIDDIEKRNLKMGACIVKISDSTDYAVYRATSFGEKGSFTFVD